MNTSMKIRRIVVGAVVGGSLLIGGPAAAFASVHTSTVKAGSACTKAQLNKTTTVSKKEFVCKKSGKLYKWATK
jgi:hypothetical protein